MRSKIRWFTEFCNSHYVSHFAAFFIVARAKISVVESCLHWWTAIVDGSRVSFMVCFGCANKVAQLSGFTGCVWVKKTRNRADNPQDHVLTHMAPWARQRRAPRCTKAWDVWFALWF